MSIVSHSEKRLKQTIVLTITMLDWSTGLVPAMHLIVALQDVANDRATLGKLFVCDSHKFETARAPQARVNLGEHPLVLSQTLVFFVETLVFLLEELAFFVETLVLLLETLVLLFESLDFLFELADFGTSVDSVLDQAQDIVDQKLANTVAEIIDGVVLVHELAFFLDGLCARRGGGEDGLVYEIAFLDGF